MMPRRMPRTDARDPEHLIAILERLRRHIRSLIIHREAAPAAKQRVYDVVLAHLSAAHATLWDAETGKEPPR